MTKDKLRIYYLYATFLGGALCGGFFDTALQNAAFVLTTLCLVFAYVFRSKATQDDLLYNHASFVIRTIWIYSLFLLLAMAYAGYELSLKADMGAFDSLYDSMAAGAVPDERVIQGSIQTFLTTNESLIRDTLHLCFLPPQVYAIWRFAKGASRAFHGYRVQNLRTWF